MTRVSAGTIGILLTWVMATQVQAAVALPTITSTGLADLSYDLQAEAPWMPLLWQRVTASLPDGLGTVSITAQLVSSTSYACDASDVLTLTPGHLFTLNGTAFNIKGQAGTWSGAVTGTAKLSANFTSNAVTATEALLLLKQLHYANLGGVRTLGKRQVSITLRAIRAGTLQSSTALNLVITPTANPGTPFLRFDPLTVPVADEIAFAPIASYDSRPSTALSWLLQTGMLQAHVMGNLGNGWRDVSTSLTIAPAGSTGYTVGQFAGLRVHGDETTDSGMITLNLKDGTTSVAVAVPVSVVNLQQQVTVIGDLPLEILSTATVTVPFKISSAGTYTVTIDPHPAGGSLPETGRFTMQNNSANLTLHIAPRTTSPEWIRGVLVLRDGTNLPIFRIPFRIHQLATNG